jgi:Fe-S-cluster-containing dehydrogenase component
LPKPMQTRAIYCNACHQACNEAMRVDFLRTPRHRSRQRTRNGTLT